MGSERGIIRPHEAKLEFLARTADAFWIVVALWVACAIYPEAWDRFVAHFSPDEMDAPVKPWHDREWFEKEAQSRHHPNLMG